MRCERVQFLYDEYSQGTLPVPTLGRLEEHLAGCPACRQFYDDSDAISGLIRKSTEVAHPGPQYFENLNARVLAALNRPASVNPPDPAEIIEIPSTQWRRPLWWAGGAAAAALLALAVLPSMLARTPVTILAKAPALTAPAPAPAPVQPTPTPAPNTQGQAPTPIPSYDKSATSRNADTVEEMVASIPHYGAEERDDVSEAERKANEETQARMAAVRQKIEESKTLPPEVYAQLQLLKTQVLDGTSDELRSSLRDLENLADPRISDEMRKNPLVRQVKLYSDANDNLTAGRIQEAMTLYRQIEFLDPGNQSPVRIKAALQMADLFYSEWGNFTDARNYYERCMAAQDKGIFNSTELKHVKSQLDRLERYKVKVENTDTWPALDQLHKVHHGNWEEVLAATRALSAMPGSEALLPEAARTILQRMGEDQGAASGDAALELYKLLAKQAEIQQNVDVRAWLELALGDMAVSQFQDTQQALGHYKKASASGASEAVSQARAKLNQMYDENLADMVRNRK